MIKKFKKKRKEPNIQANSATQDRLVHEKAKKRNASTKQDIQSSLSTVAD